MHRAVIIEIRKIVLYNFAMEKEDSSKSKDNIEIIGNLPIFIVKGLKDTLTDPWWKELTEKLNISILLLYEMNTKAGDAIGIEYKAPPHILEHELFKIFPFLERPPLGIVEKHWMEPDSVIPTKKLMKTLKSLNKRFQQEGNVVVILDDDLLNKSIKDLGTYETLTIGDNSDFMLPFSLFSNTDTLIETQSYCAEEVSENQAQIQVMKKEDVERAIRECVKDALTFSYMKKNDKKEPSDNAKIPIGETGLYIEDSKVYNENGDMALEPGSAKHVLFMALTEFIGTENGLDKKELMDVLNVNEKRYKEESVVTLISRTNKTLFINTKKKYPHLIKKLPKIRNKDKAKYYIDC